MGNTRSLEGVRWMWNASSEPFSKTQPAEWRRFTDVETMIIEEAFQTGKNQAILDDCRIDLKKLIQISNNDTNRQRPVKRMIPNRDEIQIRVDRFLVNPIETDRSDGGQYGFISPFIRETVRYLKLIRDGLPSQDPSIVTMVVDKAVQGIIDEGRKVGKQNEGKILGRCLSEKRQAGIQHVWKCCVYLYSLESFLFQIIHETLRFIGNEEHEQLWKDRVKTLGPFCLLLWDNPFDSKPIQSGTQVYRGAEMSEELITKLKKDSAVVPKPIYSFQAFTSCTRNRTIAEKFGNVLFIMKIRVGFSIDLHSYSKYPHEEEEILLPGITYVINSVKFDATLKKHLITLTLQQKHNQSDLSRLNLAPVDLIQANENCGEDDDQYNKFEMIISRNPLNSGDDFNLPAFLDRFRSLDPEEFENIRRMDSADSMNLDGVLYDDQLALSRIGLDDDWKIE